LNTPRQFVSASWLYSLLLIGCGVLEVSAADGGHWAFKDISKPGQPEVRDNSWPTADVDYFILRKLEKKGLKPVEDADRFTWLRRLSFDLTGLPPTVDEIRAFHADESPRAYERVVDRLLASRAFGERWARHWLDLVGYADQIGTSNNVFAQHAWRYRDYVIDSYHRDKPFDRFIREQIAGDLQPHRSAEERAANLIATGFLVLGDVEIVEADKAKLRVDIADQQVRKVSKAFLGMTIGCARCHDHKFDPIPQHDYYAMAGFFHSTSSVFKTDRGVWSDVNVIDLPETGTQRAARALQEEAHAAKVAQLKDELTKAGERKSELDERLKKEDVPKAEREKLTAERDQKTGRIGQLNREIQHAEFFAPTVPKAHGVWDIKEPGDMNITIRGNPRALGDKVARGFLQVASTESPRIPQRQSGRRELADWIAAPEHPLTARVAVNRIWQKLFGAGLVRSVDYFGLPGESPSHPELLDYLASRFVEEGWSQKRFIRQLVLSRVYRLGSGHSDSAHAADPDNHLFWRMNRHRLDAEALRDAMLAAGGKLHPSSGGPAMPLEFPQNVGGLNPKDVNPPSFNLGKWRPEHDYVRTIYLPVLRSTAQPAPAALRNVFDFAQPSEFTGQRAITAVPTQALFLMNSPVVKNHAAALAERLKEEAQTDGERFKRLWLVVLNRPITAMEREGAQEFIADGGEDAWIELGRALLASNEFLMRL
jgi:hypothetical protein